MEIKSDKKSLLIIDDKKENIKILIELLHRDYTVYFAIDALKGYEIARTKIPDIILLDIMMKPVNGFEICKKIRKNIDTSEIPVLFLTGASDRENIKKGFESGGNDFIFKPFIPAVLLQRIKYYIDSSITSREYRYLQKMELDINPLTLLPGHNSIKRHIRLLIESQKRKTVFYLDIDNFRYYNNVYGYTNGNKILLMIASLLKRTADDLGIRDLFIGNADGDDFFITMDTEVAEGYIQKIIERFDHERQAFYHDNDYKNGFIKIRNRKGEQLEFPLIALSIAGIDLRKTNYSSYLQLKDACNDIRVKAKQTASSCYLMDKRMNLI
jgi:PleD family two-component response regulator